MSNIGKVVKKRFSELKRFMSGFKGMTSTSTTSRELFKDVCGKPFPGLADKSFWRWYQVMCTLLDVYDKIPRFVAEAQKRGLSKKSIAKMDE
jgi:hypothetical protein